MPTRQSEKGTASRARGPPYLGGFTVVWMYGRWPAIRHAWPLVLIISMIQGGGQLILMRVDPVLSAFLAATTALLALYPLSHWKRYAEPTEGLTERPAMREEREAPRRTSSSRTSHKRSPS